MRSSASNPGIKLIFLCMISLLALSSVGLQAQDGLDMDQVYAEEELQFGVRAFHEGSFNKAIFSLEKSLSIKPEFRIAEEWLARAYYQNGFTSTALDMWTRLDEQGNLGAAARTMLSTLKYRRSLPGETDEQPKYVEFFKLEGANNGATIFVRPTAVVPDNDGGFYVVAFAGNEVLKFSANGSILRTFRGGLEGFNHPFDLVINPQQGLFITEFSGDRIVHCTAEGRVVRRFGGSGTGEGELLGPQCITDDGKGYLYVTDQGNQRIVKFDYEGNYILSFGTAGPTFEGLQQPTGIIAHNDLVFVSDKKLNKLFVFDESGNHVRTITNDRLSGPEGLSLYDDGLLLVADDSQVLLFEVESGSFSPLVIPDGARSRLIDAQKDANDNLLISDFNRSLISMQADFSRMYAGLFVRINQVNADDFPQVYVDLTVQRRDGSPFVGLKQENFYITEGRLPVDGGSLEYGVHDSGYAQVSLLIEGSTGMQSSSDALAQLTEQLTEQLLSEGSVHVIHAGRDPVLRLEDNADADQVRAAVLNGPSDTVWNFDQGLRLAAAPLLLSGNRRAVIYIHSGRLPASAFSTYELIHLADYLKHNDIAFYSVTLDPEGRVDPEIEFLCDKTGGEHIYAFNPAGITPVVDHLRSLKTGRYIISYRSNREPDFGRTYLPLEVQVSIFGRSGRGETGYFAPPE